MLIGLTGANGAGKDTVAAALVKHHGFTRLAFGDAIYDETSAAFGLNMRKLTASRDAKESPTPRLALTECRNIDFPKYCIMELMKKGVTDDLASHLAYRRSPREILQWWGDYRRKTDPLYFVRVIDRAIHSHAGLDGYPADIVITDIRKQDEVDLVRNHGGVVWIVRREASEAEHENDLHPTSQFWKTVTGIEVANNGSLPTLRASIETLLGATA